MTVELRHYTPIEIADEAIGQCWGKGCFTGDKLKERMLRVANKHKHASTIEHLYYNFVIDGISRACLQELARHRHASLSVKSSRYTLKELKTEKPFLSYWDETGEYEDIDYGWERAQNYLVFTDNHLVNLMAVAALDNLRSLIESGLSNDIAKYAMPESYKTRLNWSINARSLQNFLALRSNPSALWEIRRLATAVFEALPEDHKFLFEESLYVENTDT